MSIFPSSETEAREALNAYLAPDTVIKKVGSGINGIVFFTSRGSAVKIFARRADFTKELYAYKILEERDVSEVCGFNVPHLVASSEENMIIEMSLVQRPFLLDFASCCIDIDPRDAHGEEWLDQYVERIEYQHEDRSEEVFRVYNALARKTGIYHTDLRPTNIGFAES